MMQANDSSEVDTDDLNDNALPSTARKTAHGKQPIRTDQQVIEIGSDTQSDRHDSACRSRPSAETTARPSKRRAAKQPAIDRKAKKARKRRSPVDIDSDAILDSDEFDEIESTIETVPAYLANRRADFDKRCERLKALGLRIAPDYDEIYFSGDERLDRQEERPQFTHIKPVTAYRDVELTKSAGTIPAPIAQWLRDYQIQGAEFLHEAFVYQRGVILGDDMGLGKTIQVISFLTTAFGKTGDQRDAKRMRKFRRTHGQKWYPKILIVCPGSLMLNWQNELERWGWWTVYQYHGHEKRDALAAAASGLLEIMITTYTTYCKDVGLINTVQWDCVIADECHIIKNSGARTTKCMNDINALCRIGLTGTAIQNKYEELWTLLNWANPGKASTLALWRMNVSEPLRAGQSHSATVAQLAKARNTAEELVHNFLPQYFLRRMKSLIADQLPKKSDKVVFCPLTALQSKAYDSFCTSDVIQAVLNAPNTCDCGSGKSQGWCCYEEVDGISWKATVFPALQMLQKLANHLSLIVPTSETEEERHQKELRFLKIALPEEWSDIYSERDSTFAYANQDFCGKWRVLKKMLKLWYENDDKVLIFSHSVRLIKILQMLFQSTTSYNVSYLDGKMSYEERQATVDEFNSSAHQFVFLISTKAGGVGLNITSANKVVLFDPHWNPAHDLQAQDRAYRIGQTRDVDVFRLISKGTIEENIYARQIYKQQQANIGYTASAERRYFKAVQGDDSKKGEMFGLANLLAPQADSVALRDIVNKTNIAETRAGVEVVGLDLEAYSDDSLEDDASFDDPDRALSELAASIIDEPGSRRQKAKQIAKKKDPIQAVLDAAGITYTHENAEVIGTSKIEMQISSRARKAGGDAEWNRERAFAESQAPLVDEEYEDNDRTSRKYKFKPPEDVCKRQFCSMAKSQGYHNVSDFALVVEGWSQQERRQFLDSWYRDRREKLS
ncbi:hypothetical protein AMS68_004455 [Peltaster fructicola]|uniref:DNA excision repair protein ERCC-6-like 2 n=1 Tax=Peltaster fructicola TaxID=286661 RepID=A0A6H0XWG3_9PEZI|nr:hypothetical protein AMS68_004455 [Peltaster fructicola]